MNKTISFHDADGKQVFSVAIKSLKHDRDYLLTLWAARPDFDYATYDGRIYTASDVYRRF